MNFLLKRNSFKSFLSKKYFSITTQDPNYVLSSSQLLNLSNPLLNPGGSLIERNSFEVDKYLTSDPITHARFYKKQPIINTATDLVNKFVTDLPKKKQREKREQSQYVKEQENQQEKPSIDTPIKYLQSLDTNLEDIFDYEDTSIEAIRNSVYNKNRAQRAVYGMKSNTYSTSYLVRSTLNGFNFKNLLELFLNGKLNLLELENKLKSRLLYLKQEKKKNFPNNYKEINPNEYDTFSDYFDKPDHIISELQESYDNSTISGDNFDADLSKLIEKNYTSLEYFYNSDSISSIEYNILLVNTLKQFIHFYDKYIYANGIELFRTEWVLFDEELSASGLVDFLGRKPDGTFALFQFKLSNNYRYYTPDEYVLYGNKLHSRKSVEQKFIKGLEHIDYSYYWNHSLKINFYKYLLEKNYNIPVTTLISASFHYSIDDYFVNHFPLMEKEIDVLVDTCKKNIKYKKVDSLIEKPNEILSLITNAKDIHNIPINEKDEKFLRLKSKATEKTNSIRAKWAEYKSSNQATIALNVHKEIVYEREEAPKEVVKKGDNKDRKPRTYNRRSNNFKEKMSKDIQE